MIRERSVVSALAVLTIVAGIVAGPPVPVDARSDLLTNPGFEGDFSDLAAGWTENTWGEGAEGFYEPSYSVVHSGNSSQKLTVPSLGEGGVQFYQSFEDSTGVEFRGSAWLRSDEEIEVEVTLRLVGYPYSTIGSEILTVGTDWVKATTQGANANSGEAGLFIVARSTGTLYIDDAALSDAFAEPELDQNDFLANPSFEGGAELADGWVENTWGNGARVSYDPSYSEVHSGDAAQRLRVSALGDGGVQFYQSFETSAGVDYNGSVWLRADSEMQVQVLLRHVGYPYTTMGEQTLTVGTDWTKAVVTGSDPGAVEGGLFVVALSTGSLYIDDAALSGTDGPVDPPIDPPVADSFRAVDGRIIAPDGSDFVPRGINIYNSTFFPNDSPTKGVDAVDEIVGLFPNINMIRIAYQDDDENNLFWASTATDDQFLSTFVQAATSRRIVVLLEDHSTIGTFTWTQGQIDTYRTLAERYKDNPYVWFATENEPDDAPGERIAQNARATYDAIRDSGNDNMVLLLTRGGGFTDEIQTYANYIEGGAVPNYPGSGPGSGGASVTAMHNVAWDMHLYMWANPSASVAEVEETLWNGIDTPWGPFAGINAYSNGPKSADGVIPVIVGEWGLDWAGDSVMAVMLQTGPDSYPVGNLAWNWSAGGPDVLVSGDERTPYGDAVNAFIDAGTGVPAATQP